jgi:hypothetical protein
MTMMEERKEQQQPRQTGYGSINDRITSQDRVALPKRSRTNVSIALATFGLALLIISIVVTILYNPSILQSLSSSSSTTSSTSISMVALASSSSSSSSTTTTTGSDSGDTNRLVDLLQRSSTIIHPQSYYKSKVDEYPSMYIDLEHERQVYNGHSTTERSIMTISWTDGQFRDSHDSILTDDTNDKNIVALQCGDSDSRLHIVDAKTLSDAASTSSTEDNNARHRQLRSQSTAPTGTHRMLKWYDYYGLKDIDWWGGSGTLREKAWRSNWNSNNNNNNNDYKDSDNSKWHTTEHYESSSSSYNSENNYYGGDGSNEWYIGSVPSYILNQRKCQAIIYYHIHDDEYVVVGKSTILHL